MFKNNAHSMDQNKDIYGLDSKCDIDLNEVVKFSSGNEKKKVARRRWGILAKALKLVPKYCIWIVNIKEPCRFYCVLIYLRADYWKSQERKYCDFCKCWIADNKPSVEFHEKGRRHQENVKKRLAHISRTSAKAQRDSDKVDLQIKAMEAAALAAYQMDVQNNADLTSIAINKKVEKNNLAIKNGEKKVWQEAKSKDGNIYYWNMMTNETKWEKPAEGYTSLEEQEKEKFDEAAKQLRAIERERQKEGLLRIQEQRKEEAEEKARLAREKMKERAVKNDLEPIQYGPIIEPGKTNPYGRWEKVKESAPVVDLQLPPQQEYYAPVIELEPEPIVKEFKERTIESLDEGGPSTFKKRKFGGGAKRNTRQRLDDD